MAEKSLPLVDHASGKASRCCAGCGDTKKARMAPRPNAREYTGDMFCMSCNPRFAATAATRLLVTP